jgi:hypothetical protein
MEYLYRRAAEAPKQIGERIAVPAGAPPGRIAKLIADLGDEEFAVREAAVKELEALGVESVPHLQTVAEKSASAEVRKLATDTLIRIDKTPPSPEELRAVRAVEILENLATADARAVLSKLAAGPAGHRLTLEATAALARLKSRSN